MAKKGTQSVKVINDTNPLGFAFFVAYIGAAIYFIQQSDGFWGVILGLLQAIVWPAYVLYHVLQLLNV